MTSELEQKYKDIRTEYENVWLKKRYKGVRIYTSSYIYLKLGEKFYLKPATIENIIFHRIKLVSH